MDRLHNTVRDVYRLIVIRRNGSELLLRSRRGAWLLPSVEISPGQRIAEQLCAKLYAQYGFRAYCLLVPNLAAGFARCAVLEVPDPGAGASAETCWIARDAATCAAMESAEDRIFIEKSFGELGSCRRKPKEAPFARLGWLSELFAWAEQQLDPLGVRLTGAFTHLNASPACSLMRLETDDSAVWFKAVGEQDRHELAVTACLARLFPESVPELLAIHVGWNGWLTRAVRGQTLNHATELAAWLKAAEDLARLQIESIGKHTELLEGSCRDLTLPKLIEEIDPFVDRMRGLMAAQEKQTPAPLANTELALLRDGLKRSCSRLSEFGLPDTLGHLDFNPGNIVVSPARCVFLDWAQACVTSPLVTFEYLREHFRRNCTDDRSTVENLVAAYVQPWQSVFSPDVLKQALRFSPLVAVFAYAADARRSSGPCDTSFSRAYFRSLARRMFREAGQVIERSERCPA